MPSLFLGNYNQNMAVIEKRGAVTVFHPESVSFEAKIKDLESYYNDHFGARESFIQFYNFVKLKLFGLSGNGGMIVGKEGWYFYNNEGVIDDIEGKRLFDKAQLEIMLKNLEERNAWLKKQGIDFYLLIVPNKHTIYSEFLPKYIQVYEGEKGIDQVYNYLKKHATFPVYNSTKKLLALKKEKQCYQKTDTHWTSEASFEVYQAIMQQWFLEQKNVRIISSKEVTSKYRNTSGDLINFIALNDYIREDLVETSVANKRAVERGRVDCLQKAKVANYVLENLDTSLAKLYLMRDSYGSALIPFLSESFSTLTSAWSHNFKDECINNTQPDIVIHQVVERYLHRLLLNNSSQVKFSNRKDVGKE